MNFTPKEFEKYQLLPSDILLNEGNLLTWSEGPPSTAVKSTVVVSKRNSAGFRASEAVILTTRRSFFCISAFERFVAPPPLRPTGHLTFERLIPLNFRSSS